MNQKPVVAHINLHFFAKSQTFIYNYISNLNEFYPVCLAWELINLELFPFPKDDLYNIDVKKFSPRWFFKKIFNNELKEEKIIKKREVKLLHAHFGPYGFYAARLKTKFKLPLITTFYGSDISKLTKEEEWLKKYKTLFKVGDLFLVEGQHMKSCLLSLGCPEEKIRIQRIAISLDKINFAPKRAKKQNEKVLLIFSGRFIEKKGIIFALKAINKVREDFKNFEFHIIGNGELKSEIENFISRYHMNEYVKLLGFLTYDRYIYEMQKADIFIHPSVTASDGDSEGGAPTTILEAQAMGMPVISTYHADIPNIVVPGQSALLSNEKDVSGLANNIIFLLKNQNLWSRMGEVGREFVFTNHNINKEIVNLENIYKTLI